MLKRLDPPSLHEDTERDESFNRKPTGKYVLLFYSSPSQSTGSIESTPPMTYEEGRQIEEASKTFPQEIAPGYWWYRDWLYKTAERDLTADDIRALALERENKKRLQVEKAHALMAMREQLDSKAKRQPIPQQTKVVVWQRDRGRCVECGSQEELEYDHIIPLAMGGSNTERNLQLLCAVCNRRKGPTLG